MERIQHALQHYKQSEPSRESTQHLPSTISTAVPSPLVYSETKTVSVPSSSFISRRMLLHTQDGPFVEAYKMLRIQILHRLREHSWNVIGVTSARRQEGKTLVATNLAMSIAMEQGHTSILLDANLRNPQVHKLFDIENRGLADYLLDDIPFPELLVHPEIDRFVVMPAGGPIKNSVETLTLAKTARLVEEIKNRYHSRFVIFDLPPLLETADVIGIAPQLDTALFVVEGGRTTETDIRKSLSLLNNTVPLLGIVMNKAGRLSGGVSA